MIGLSSLLRPSLSVMGSGVAPKPAVVAMPSPNHSSRNGAKIDTIVLHHTAGGGTAQDVGRYFQSRSAGTSSHYIVGKDGVIVQPVADDRSAWHAGRSEYKGRSNVNNFSLGIEIVNRGDGHDPYTDAQYQALARLTVYLQTTYGIGWDRVTGHKDVALPRGRKSDPSSNFSYDRLRQEVAKLSGGVAPAPTPKAPVVPATVRKGAKGEVVKLLQERLKAAGFNPGTPDGDFGPMTDAAVRAFQKAKGLDVDGVAGPMTWAALTPKPAPKPAPAPKPVPIPVPVPAPIPAPAPGCFELDLLILSNHLKQA